MVYIICKWELCDVVRYNQMPLTKTVILTFGYLFLSLLSYSLILYVFKLAQTPTMGLICVPGIIGCGQAFVCCANMYRGGGSFHTA